MNKKIAFAFILVLCGIAGFFLLWALLERVGFGLTFSLIVLAALGALVVAGEVFCRVGLGLGDPPLSIVHPAIGYMFAPSSTYRRFGNRIATNAYSMRSDEFSKERSANEVRVLVLGDSVINGGNLTDQKDLATELLKDRLGGLVSVPVVVGNVSAGTWSPANLLAYVEHFGTFDADAAVIIINDGDIYDTPKIEDMNPHTHPLKRPRSALLEMISRYLIPRLVRLVVKQPIPSPLARTDGVRKDYVQELEQLIQIFETQEIPVFLLFHPRTDEMTPAGEFEPRDGYARATDFARQKRIELGCLAPPYGDSIRAGIYPFRDLEHPNLAGQRIICDTLLDWLERTGLTEQWRQRR